jgi:hypothetical protein
MHDRGASDHPVAVVDGNPRASPVGAVSVWSVQTVELFSPQKVDIDAEQ